MQKHYSYISIKTMAISKLQYITREVRNLRNEFISIRFAFAALLAEDKEGHYKRSFVAKTKRAIKEKSLFRYRNKKSFLEHLRS